MISTLTSRYRIKYIYSGCSDLIPRVELRFGSVAQCCGRMYLPLEVLKTTTRLVRLHCMNR